MPFEEFPKLSSLKDDLIYVMCLDCELLKRMDYNGLFGMYEDVELFSLPGRIAKDVIQCGKNIEGYHDRCRLRFYHGHETKKIKFEKPASPLLEYLCSWEIGVGKCSYCGYVSNLERWRVSKVTKPGMTLDDLRSFFGARNAVARVMLN